jgi:hypothetical protein
MSIKFLHIPLEIIDRLCEEEEKVVILVNAYRTERHSDGTIEERLIAGWGATIRRSKDLFQFDNEDIKTRTDDTKEKLR